MMQWPCLILLRYCFFVVPFNFRCMFDFAFLLFDDLFGGCFNRLRCCLCVAVAALVILRRSMC